MTDRRIDPRVVKTQRRLRRALVELMQSMPVGSISVQHITSRANVTRGTFYLHYRDKKDFVSITLTQVLDDFFRAVSVNDNVILGRKLLRLQTFGVEAAFLYLHRHPAEASVLFDDRHKDYLFSVLKKRLYQNVAAFTKQADENDTEQSVKLEMQQAFIIHGVLGLFSCWVDKGMKENAVEMTDDLEQLLSHNDLHLAVSKYFNTKKINNHS